MAVWGVFPLLCSSPQLRPWPCGWENGHSPLAGSGVAVLIEFIRNLSSGMCRKSPLWDAGKLLRRNCLSRPLTLKTPKVLGEPQTPGAADHRYCWIRYESTTCSSISWCCRILHVQDQVHLCKVLIALKMACGQGPQNQNPARHVLPTPLCLWYRRLHMAPTGDGKPFKGPRSTIWRVGLWRVNFELRGHKFKASTP